jgi:hypothetical protein
MMRAVDHGGAADFYKQGNFRGNCVEIVLELSFGAVGFLINGAQRARRRVKHDGGGKFEVRNSKFESNFQIRMTKDRNGLRGQVAGMSALAYGIGGATRGVCGGWF